LSAFRDNFFLGQSSGLRLSLYAVTQKCAPCTRLRCSSPLPDSCQSFKHRLQSIVQASDFLKILIEHNLRRTLLANLAEGRQLLMPEVSVVDVADVQTAVFPVELPLNQPQAWHISRIKVLQLSKVRGRIHSVMTTASKCWRSRLRVRIANHQHTRV
jgi:hypothetical protein